MEKKIAKWIKRGVSTPFGSAAEMVLSFEAPEGFRVTDSEYTGSEPIYHPDRDDKIVKFLTPCRSIWCTNDFGDVFNLAEGHDSDDPELSRPVKFFASKERAENFSSSWVGWGE